MYPVPITYLFDFEFCTEKMRPFIMEEFAANGARHLVLSDVLISQCFAQAAALLGAGEVGGLDAAFRAAPAHAFLRLVCGTVFLERSQALPGRIE